MGSLLSQEEAAQLGWGVCTHHRPPALLETRGPWFNAQTEPQTELHMLHFISLPL